MCYAYIKKVEKIDEDDWYVLYSVAATVSYILLFNLFTIIYLLDIFEVIKINLWKVIVIAIFFMVFNKLMITYDKIYKHKFKITKKHILIFIAYILLSFSVGFFVLQKSRKNNFYKKEYKKIIRKGNHLIDGYYIYFKDKTRLSLDVDDIVNKTDSIKFDKYIKKGDSFIKKKNSFKIIIKSKRGEKHFFRNF